MSHETLGVGVWGLGQHALRNILPAIGRCSRAELVAVHTRNESVLRDVAGSTGIRAHAHPDDLLEDRAVDVVYLATPTGLHAAMAGRVIDAGKHLWCEKPLTDSYELTASLLADVRAAGLVALEADMFVHHPQFRQMLEIAGSGQLGSIVSATARFGFPHREGNDFRYSKELGGGALLDAGFYPVAAAVGLLGHDLELAGSTIGFTEGIGVDTGGTALAISAAGAALLDWGFGRSYRSEINVWCEDGVVDLARAFAKPADLETRIAVRHQSGEETVYQVPPADHFALMLEHFAAVTSGALAFDSAPILTRSRLLTDIRAAAL